MSQQNIETLLAEQSNQLDKERHRLLEDLNGLHFSNGSGDYGGSAENYQNHHDDNGELPEPESVRSNGSHLDADKLHKEQMNQAISDQKSESNYEPPRTGRRFVRPQVRSLSAWSVIEFLIVININGNPFGLKLVKHDAR